MFEHGTHCAIGLICCRLHQNGIGRAILNLVPVFRRLGLRVFVLTGKDPRIDPCDLPSYAEKIFIGVGTERQQRLKEVLQKNNISVVIDHWYFNLPIMRSDYKTIVECGAKFVIHWHSVFSWGLVNLGSVSQRLGMMEMCREADAVIAINRASACFFDAIGCRVCYIQNPVVSQSMGSHRDDLNARTGNVVWIGRVAPNKRADDAIEIMRMVHRDYPNVELHIVGDADDTSYGRQLRQRILNDSVLSQFIHFEGFRPDVYSILGKARVLLSTSAFEGMSYVLVEALQSGVPVVQYDLPYLDFVSENSGVVSVPQLNRQAAQREVEKLLFDDGYWLRQHRNALATAHELEAYDSEERYCSLFRCLTTGGRAVLEFTAKDYKIALQTLAEHSDAAIDVLSDKRYVIRKTLGMVWGCVRHPTLILHVVSKIKEGKTKK